MPLTIASNIMCDYIIVWFSWTSNIPHNLSVLPKDSVIRLSLSGWQVQHSHICSHVVDNVRHNPRTQSWRIDSRFIMSDSSGTLNVLSHPFIYIHFAYNQFNSFFFPFHPIVPNPKPILSYKYTHSHLFKFIVSYLGKRIYNWNHMWHW